MGNFSELSGLKQWAALVLGAALITAALHFTLFKSQREANAQAQKMIDEARDSAAHVAERKQQEAVAAAEQIMAKAREASAIEHERTMTELKRELGRLVVDTTAKVTGKVLTSEDQRRLQEEASRQIAS